MWPCEREKKKKKEKEEEYEKTQKKMDGRRIKVCNKMGRLNQIGADSGQNRPIPAETGTYTAKHADTANSGRNRPKWAAAAILLLNVALWEKKKNEEEYKKTQKQMDGRRIKVCNKRI